MSSSRLLSTVILIWAFPVLVRSAETENAASGSKIFTCRGRPAGYYADLESGCQRYHMCDAGGRRYSYSCPNQTLFQQRVMICDHWFMVDCSLSESFFGANSLIGQKDKLFVEPNDEFFRKSQEESSLNRRYQGRRPVDRKSATYLASQAAFQRASTTPYPWNRISSTSTIATVIFREDSQINSRNNATSQFSKYPSGQLFPSKKVPDEKVSIIKFGTVKKDHSSFVTPFSKVEPRTLPIAFANNPFFRSVTAGTSEAPQLIYNKGQPAGLLTAAPFGPLPVQRDQFVNVFAAARHGANKGPTSTATSTSYPVVVVANKAASSTPLAVDESFTTRSPQELRQRLPNLREVSPSVITARPTLTSDQKFVTSQGQAHQFEKDTPELRNSLSRNGVTAFEITSVTPMTTRYEVDLGVDDLLPRDDEEDLLSNTVEFRVPDVRRLFFIPDSPSREAEMLNATNETVLTIALSPPRHHGPMRFKGSRSPKGPRDDCPQCHPAFLFPGSCQPCVLIR